MHIQFQQQLFGSSIEFECLVFLGRLFQQEWRTILTNGGKAFPELIEYVCVCVLLLLLMIIMAAAAAIVVVVREEEEEE